MFFASTIGNLFYLWIMGTTPHRQRSTSDVQRVVKAAGSQSLKNLIEVIEAGGWTGREIDQLAEENRVNKNPTHMAAWKGCIENLKYLIETVGCDVNVISKGEFSYGKTPIFFALTLSREDVVEYLLEKCDAQVRIVNNKGQTPLSIASSHFDGDSIIQRILAKEIKQQQKQNIPWINYRATHSDGLEYGDLDPRFLDRPIRESDRVTEYAVNPTTAQSRKGNFLRNNAHIFVAREGAASKQSRRKKKLLPETNDASSNSVLDLALVREEEVAWSRLIRGWTYQNLQDMDLLLFVRLKIRQRRAWIQETAEELEQQQKQHQLDMRYMLDFIEAVMKSQDSLAEEGEVILLKRLLLYLKHDKTSRICSPMHSKSIDLSDSIWKSACEYVQDLSISIMETDKSPFLSLPMTPVWIDSVEELRKLAQTIHSDSILAIDSEWYCDYNGNGMIRPSLLQVATIQTVWLIDLLHKNDDDQEFQTECQALIRTLFNNKILLGFAMANDIPKLELYIGKKDDPTQPKLPRDKCLDLQWLFCYDDNGNQFRRDTPGLASCVQQCSTKKLSKTQQRSNWSLRPLSISQIEYAGLDAFVLFFLLAEKNRSRVITNDK